MPTAPPRRVRPVVGRAREIAQVMRFVAGLPSGARPLVLTGEPGIGKTTLWRLGCEAARTAGCHVLLARPIEDDVGVHGAGLSELLGRPPATAGSATADLAGLTEFFATTVAQRLGTAPVLVAVDDLQWLDESTSRLVRRMARQFGGRALSLLGTARTGGAHLGGVVRFDLGPWEADAVEVGPASVDDLASILLNRGVDVRRPDVERIHRATGGNPFHAVEVARRWDRGEGPALQASPAGMLADQVQLLPDRSRRLLHLLALAGPLPAGELAGLAGIDDPLAALDPELTDLVDVDEAFTLRCAHPLIAAGVRLTLSPAQARELHGRLAAAATDPVTRARHLARSLLRPDPVAAAELAEAARVVARQGSPAAAADLVRHSRRLTPAPMVEDRVRRGLAEMRYCAAAGDLPRAAAIGTELLELRLADDLRADVLGQQVIIDLTDAETTLRAAAVGMQGPGRARVLELLGWRLGLYQGRLGEGIGVCTAAVLLASAGSDEAGFARAAATLATLSALAGRPQPELMRRAAAARSPGLDVLLRVRPAVFEARLALWNGDPAAARPGLEALREEARRMGSEFQRPYRQRDIALLELAAGRLAPAADAVADGVEAAEEARNAQALAWLAYPSAKLAALRGDADGVAQACDVMLHRAASHTEPLRTAAVEEIRALLASAGRDWPTAVEHGRRGLARLDDLGLVHPGHTPVLPRLAEAAALAGDEATLAMCVARLVDADRRLAADGITAMATVTRGHQHLLAGDPRLALASYEAAGGTQVHLGQGLEVARTRYFAALAQLRLLRRADAVAGLEAAREEFARQGVAGWTDLCADQAARLAAEPATRLTATEAAVVDRVRRGLRNRDIAAELFLSVSTVEAHLTRLYRRLGVRGRAELIARLGDDSPSPTGPPPG